MIVKCSKWIDCGVRDGGCCSDGVYERPSYGTCLLACTVNDNKPSRRDAQSMIDKHKNKPKGLGDTVEKVIKVLSRGKAKPCSGCKKRKEALNKLMPYKDK